MRVRTQYRAFVAAIPLSCVAALLLTLAKNLVANFFLVVFITAKSSVTMVFDGWTVVPLNRPLSSML